MSNTIKKEKDDHTKAVCDMSKHKSALFDAKALANFINNGAIGVIETDTIYALVGSVFYHDVVNRLYQVKRRNIKTPFMILISDVEQMKYFGVNLTPELLSKIREYWPGNYSIALPLQDPDKFYYLTRGSSTLCFRMPSIVSLFELIDLTGPILVTSANVEGQPYSKTIQEAYEYFSDKIDFYCDSGKVDRKPSKIIEFKGDEVIYHRN